MGLALMPPHGGENPSSFRTVCWTRPKDSGFWPICEAHIDPFWELNRAIYFVKIYILR
jgi:hypothetical protein